MKKIFLFFVIICLIGFTMGCKAQKTIVQDVTSDILPVVEAPEQSECNLPKDENGFAVETDDVWGPTFQLCWNEFINLIGTPKVEYVEGKPKLADELNKQKFIKDDLNPDDYYIAVGKQTLKLKRSIEKGIWDKFKEKSDILDKFTFPDIADDKTNQWFIYSMLLKNFPFIARFDNLPNDYFNKIETQKYKYFGFMKDVKFQDRDSDENKDKLEGTIESLFYANDNDFALKITDKNDKEEMILYLTDSNASFEQLYSEIKEKSLKKKEYTQNRTKDDLQKHPNAIISIVNYYKIPYLHIDRTTDFNKELADKDIKGKDYINNPGDIWVILKTLQTVKFDMDNKGARLKSEAALRVADKIAMYVEKIYLEDFYYFDRPFVLFLKEKGKDKPYFAVRIKDGKYLVKG